MPRPAACGRHEEGAGGTDARHPSVGECVGAQGGAHGAGQVGTALGPVKACAHRRAA